MYIKDIPFKPDCSDKTLTRAKDWLVANKKNFMNTANFAVINDRDTDSRPNQPCHGGIASSAINNRVCVATETGWRRGRKTEEDITPFLNYFLNESYASRFLLVRDFEFVRDYGVVVSADMPTPLMQNILLITRHFYECNVRSFTMFNKLLSDGINPHLAFHFTFNSLMSATAYQDKDLETFALASKNAHRTQPLPAFSELQNIFLSRLGSVGAGMARGPTYRTSLSFYGGTTIFLESRHARRNIKDDILADPALVALIKERRTQMKGGEMYRPPNPFAPSVRQPLASNDVSMAEFYEVVVPYLDKKVKAVPSFTDEFGEVVLPSIKEGIAA